jgi:hypothetical protein
MRRRPAIVKTHCPACGEFGSCTEAEGQRACLSCVRQLRAVSEPAHHRMKFESAVEERSRIEGSSAAA